MLKLNHLLCVIRRLRPPPLGGLRRRPSRRHPLPEDVQQVPIQLIKQGLGSDDGDVFITRHHTTGRQGTHHTPTWLLAAVVSVGQSAPACRSSSTFTRGGFRVN